MLGTLSDLWRDVFAEQILLRKGADGQLTFVRRTLWCVNTRLGITLYGRVSKKPNTCSGLCSRAGFSLFKGAGERDSAMHLLVDGLIVHQEAQEIVKRSSRRARAIKFMARWVDAGGFVDLISMRVMQIKHLACSCKRIVSVAGAPGAVSAED